MRKVGIATLLAVGAASGLWLGRRHLLAKMMGLPPPRYEMGVERGLQMTTPDGTTLVADHYYPKTAGDFPTLLRRTPYGRNGSLGPLGLIDDARARVFAERGYHVVMQDVRGRGDSGGEFTPLEDESADGRAAMTWVSKQPWFNGALGLWGESYNGYTQWAVTPDAPAYLKALLPAISSANGYNYPYSPGGAFHLLGRWQWLKGIEETRQMKPWYRIKPGERRIGILVLDTDPALAHLPLRELDELMIGRALPFYRASLDNPNPSDSYWQAMNHRASLPQLAAPAHLVGGWYDVYLDPVLRDYAALHDAGRKPYLTIGPWTHGLSPMLEALRQALPWFETYLKGEPGQLRDMPVRYYLMGADEWREAEDWPLPGRETRYYLHQGGALSVTPPEAHSAPDSYRYDPAAPTPSVGGNSLFPPHGALDNQALEARPDVLTYTTAPLDGDVDVVGPVRAELYVQSSLDYTDFFARLCDVYPDGRSINICDGLLRVTPGIGEAQPDGSLRLEIDMTATAMRFHAGHCLRLQVSSGAFPRFNRNLGTGEPLATATQMQVANQIVYHAQAQPSALVLPIQPSQRLKIRRYISCNTQVLPSGSLKETYLMPL